MRTYILVLAASLLFLLTGCVKKQAKSYTIGVSQCSGGPWRDKMNDEMRRELLFHSNIDIEFTNACDNSGQQEKDIQGFIDKKVDLLVVSPADAHSLTPIIAKAFDEGIPVIVVDRLVDGDKYTAFVGGDNEAIGHEMADYVIQNLKNDGGKVIEIMGLAGSSPVTLRHKGFVDGMKGHDNIQIVGSVDGKWTPEGVRAAITPILKANPDVKIIVAQNDAMACDANKVAKELLPNSRILVMGVDGLPLVESEGLRSIEKEELDATAVYPTGGNVIVKTAVNILNSQPYERKQTLQTFLVNTIEQARMLNEQAQQEKHEQETIQMLKGKVDYYWEQYSLQNTFLWTLVICLLIFLCLLVVLLYLLKQRTLLTKKLREASQAKLSFFTGVSHDFRTPLTLISGPISSLAADKSLNDDQKLLVQIADKNTRVLLRLINQVLDFRKYESGKLELNFTDTDLRTAEKEWFDAFNGLADRRKITLVNNVSEGDFRMKCDIQKLERVFFNLMGNSFKFTPEGGTITVSLAHIGGNIILSIADTGSGIPADKKDKVFEDFYQIKSTNSSGSGIGLAVVKCFVELHGGTITVEDNKKAGHGTEFTISIPFLGTGAEDSMLKDYSSQNLDTSSMAQINAEVLSTKNAEIELSSIEEQTFVPEDEKRPVMLIIDDNRDIITFLKFQFEHKYRIFTAENGAEGVQKALQIVPDIIICDLMMPVMNGVECCRHLRSELATSHIPVIMLTACSIDEERIKSHEGGADAYITKPFNLDVLQAQVDVLINNRKHLIETIKSELQTKGDMHPAEENTETATRREIILSALDEQFLHKLNKFIEKNIPNCNYSVELLSEDLELSRSQLFRKVKALTGVTPNELIRNARLEKARELLTTSQDDISEVAAKVGFNTPSYFTKCYKEYFGGLPNNISN